MSDEPEIKEARVTVDVPIELDEFHMNEKGQFVLALRVQGQRVELTDPANPIATTVEIDAMLSERERGGE